MKEKDEWKLFSWYCLNCAGLVTGFKRRNGEIKVVCEHCGSTMVRRLKTPQHDVVDIYAPAGMERIG